MLTMTNKLVENLYVFRVNRHYLQYKIKKNLEGTERVRLACGGGLIGGHLRLLTRLEGVVSVLELVDRVGVSLN
ncbi:hypothetical protein BpHYR1_003186 [Brachionus plicatilis]|uniref:Uncharacterized protein n=1 Tax=Brachionus plicatilis TaxID=10195 RepID=A0A3M7RPJ7_BRAPC|nr:hypothetical protein BpHYR1_003186 [Brachionus plicatilis]